MKLQLCWCWLKWSWKFILYTISWTHCKRFWVLDEKPVGLDQHTSKCQEFMFLFRRNWQAEICAFYYGKSLLLWMREAGLYLHRVFTAVFTLYLNYVEYINVSCILCLIRQTHLKSKNYVYAVHLQCYLVLWTQWFRLPISFLGFSLIFIEIWIEFCWVGGFCFFWRGGGAYAPSFEIHLM